MYQYEIVRINFTYSFWKKVWQPCKDYHLIIREYISQGWRFVDIFASPTKGWLGGVEYIEIYFERNVKPDESVSDHLKIKASVTC